MDHVSRLDLIRNLRDRTRRMEAAARPERRFDDEPREKGLLARLLRGEGFAPGTLIEWVGGEGAGAATLALAVAGRVLRGGGGVVVVDAAGEVYPPALAGLGVPLERTVIVRPDDPRAGPWVWEQALRCSGVAVTFGRADTLTDRHFHRLQLAAEAGGGLGFLLRAAGAGGMASKAAVRLRVSGRPGRGPLEPLGRRLRVEVLHCRGAMPGEVVEVELGHEAGDVRVVASVADPALAAGPA